MTAKRPTVTGNQEVMCKNAVTYIDLTIGQLHRAREAFASGRATGPHTHVTAAQENLDHVKNLAARLSQAPASGDTPPLVSPDAGRSQQQIDDEYMQEGVARPSNVIPMPAPVALDPPREPWEPGTPSPAVSQPAAGEGPTTIVVGPCELPPEVIDTNPPTRPLTVIPPVMLKAVGRVDAAHHLVRDITEALRASALTTPNYAAASALADRLEAIDHDLMGVLETLDMLGVSS